MNTPLLPNPGYVVIQPIEHEKSTFQVVEKDKQPKKGTVLAIGDPVITEGGQKYSIHEHIKVGDTIWHRGYSSEDFTEKGKKYKVVSFRDVFGKVSDGK